MFCWRTSSLQGGQDFRGLVTHGSERIRETTPMSVRQHPPRHISMLVVLSVAAVLGAILVYIVSRDEENSSHYSPNTASGADKSPEWRVLERGMESEEVPLTALEETYLAFKKLEKSGVSFKQRNIEREKINSSRSFAYAAYHVLNVHLAQNEAGLDIWCEGDFFDPRTGQRNMLATYFFTGGCAVSALRKLNANEVDHLNAAYQEAMRGPSDYVHWQNVNQFIDFERASELLPGDPLVCRVTLFIDENENGRLVTAPVRRLALNKPRLR